MEQFHCSWHPQHSARRQSTHLCGCVHVSGYWANETLGTAVLWSLGQYGSRGKQCVQRMVGQWARLARLEETAAGFCDHVA